MNIKNLIFAVLLAMTFGSFAVNAEEIKPATPVAVSAPNDDGEEEPVSGDSGKDQKNDPGKGGQPKENRSEEYKKAIKDLERHEGAFTFYIRKKDILIELPEERLGKLFFIQAALHTGIAPMVGQAGDPLGMESVDVFRWEMQDEKIKLVRPNIKFRWDPNDPLALASQRSFPEAVLADYRIEQQDPDRKLYLVNVTGLFQGELFHLNELLNAAGAGSFMLDRDDSIIDRVKSFKDNSIVRVRLNFQNQRGSSSGSDSILALLGLAFPNNLEDSRSAPVKVTYNLWYRKESDYQPRLADPRIGYFTQDFYSVSRFMEDDRTERYIMRFNLQKKEPLAKVSAPIEPIVWYIDPSVPKQYRESVRQGVLRWNKAFEKLGYRGAIEVKDVPENDPDWDHADGRFNVIRWVMSQDAGYAISLFRTDPFTGEILNASITFDANMLAFADQEFRLGVVPASTAIPKAMKAVLRTEPGEDPIQELLDPVAAQKEKLSKMALRNGWKSSKCDHARCLEEHASFAYNAAIAVGAKVSKDEFAQQFIADVICHEVGHCLGLRHNFVGSANLTTAQLANDDLVREQGVSASVMDYVPTNMQAVLKGSGVYFNTAIGVYDSWAIRYGYCDKHAPTPQGETKYLATIACESGKPGHAYMSDEDANGVDPLVARFDASADPLAYAELTLEAAKRTRDWALTNLPKTGESYAKRNALVLGSSFRAFREGQKAARFIGGVRTSRNHKGDIGEKPTLQPVDAETQRQALRLIARHCLSVKGVELPPSAMINLSLDYNDGSGYQFTAPLRHFLGTSQIALLARLMSATVTDNILENEFKLVQSKSAYTLTEHYTALMNATFEELDSGAPIQPTRRDLQKFALAALLRQCTAEPGAISEDVKAVASHSLKQLHQKIDKALKLRKIDSDIVKVHLSEMKDTIERYHSRQIVVPY